MPQLKAKPFSAVLTWPEAHTQHPRPISNPIITPVNSPKLYKRAALNRTLDVCQIPEHEIDQLLILLFAEPADKVLARELFAEPVRRQPVLGKAEVEQRSDGQLGRAELLLLLSQIGAADEANGAFVAQGGEKLEHGGRDGLGREKGVGAYLR